MGVQCEGDRCNRCALARGYPEQPAITSPPPRGWEAVIDELRRLNVPLVAFGQTVLWDEPAKAVLRLMLDRLAPEIVTIAGIHDSDYFSKLHGHGRAGHGYVLWGNNDWSHRELWSAVGEVSALFGAEQAPTVHAFLAAGVPLKELAARSGQDRSAFLDRATSAHGWRGLAQLGPTEQIARDVLVSDVGPYLVDLLTWGLEGTIAVLEGEEAQRAARAKADQLLERLRAAIAAMPSATISRLFQRLITDHYADLLGYPPRRMQTTATVDYLRFNRATAARPRFQALQAFLCDRVGECARATYNEVIAGAGMYSLDLFGEGAVPFDLVVPGRGRGTLRVLDREVRAELEPQPLVIPTRERVIYLEELAALLEGAVGPEVAIAGKALLGPVMFCSEALLVLHEGASAYVPRTRQWLARLGERCASMRTYAILRLGHGAFDALSACPATLRLPEHLAQAFGAETISASEFGQRWRDVRRAEEDLLGRLGQARSAPALLEAVASAAPDGWARASRELASASRVLRDVGSRVEELRAHLARLRSTERQARYRRADLERRSGELRRAGQPREATRHKIALASEEIAGCQAEREPVRGEIAELSRGPAAQAARETIARLSLAAERARLILARRALLTRGLDVGNRRPTGWWFSIVDPSGEWFAEAVRRAEVWLDDLTRPPPAPADATLHGSGDGTH
jgi:hypothetical protein